IGKPAEASSVSRRLTLAGAGAAAAVAAGALLFRMWPREPDPPSPAPAPPQKPAPLFTATVVPMVASDKAAITLAGAPPADNGTPPSPGTPDPALYSVNYRYSRTADGFAVDYQLPYLDLLRAGGPIAGIHYETSPFLEPFPPFRATIANNSAQQ